MLDLSADAGAGVREGSGLSRGVPVQSSDARVVVLTREDDAAELEVAGLVEALGEGDVSANALGLAFLQEDFRKLLQGAARQLGLRVLAPAKEGHLLCRGMGLAHDLGLGCVIDAEVVRQQLCLGDRQLVQVGVHREPLRRGGVGVEAVLNEHIERGANGPGSTEDAVVFAARAVLPGRRSPRLIGSHELADLLCNLEREDVDVVQIVVGPVDYRVVHALGAASVGVEGDEDVAPLRCCAALIDAEVGVDVRPGGNDLEAPGLQLGLELEVQLPDHRALVVGLHDRALIVLAADVSGVEANLDLTHHRRPPPRQRGR